MVCGDEGAEERQTVLSSSTRGRHLRHHEDSFRFCPVAVRQTLSAVTRQCVYSCLLKQLWEINPTLESGERRCRHLSLRRLNNFELLSP